MHRLPKYELLEIPNLKCFSNAVTAFVLIMTTVGKWGSNFAVWAWRNSDDVIAGNCCTTKRHKCDPLWKNLHRVLGMDQRRIYCRVQGSKSQVLKRLLNWVVAVPQFTNFRERSILYVHSSTFSVSVYALYYATRFVCHNEFAGKDVHRQSATTWSSIRLSTV